MTGWREPTAADLNALRAEVSHEMAVLVMLRRRKDGTIQTRLACVSDPLLDEGAETAGPLILRALLGGSYHHAEPKAPAPPADPGEPCWRCCEGEVHK